MKTVRLLPIVIFAALALLVFKGIGLVTNGGYVLMGPVAAVAAEGTPAASADAPTAGDATMTDSNPVLGDSAPTLPTAAPAAPEAAHGDASASHGDAAAPASADGSAPAAAEAPAAPAHDAPAAADHAPAPAIDAAANPAACPNSPPAEASSAAAGNLTDSLGTALANGCPSDQPAVDVHGDAIPSTRSADGTIVPLANADGDTSRQALLQRLSTRSAELDKRQAELDMRDAILAAAQKKLDEQTKAMQDLQTQVSATVDQKKAAEDENFKGIVTMYEAMKPADAAKIFDTLNLDVLLKIAQAMSPRKMSPVLALMKPQAAEALTTAFATSAAPPTAVVAGENLAALPQIVGQ